MMQHLAKHHAYPGWFASCAQGESEEEALILDECDEMDMMNVQGKESTGKQIEKKGGWKKIKAIVDTGASRPVIPPDLLPEIPIQATEESRNGHSFRGAQKGGPSIAKLGEQTVIGMTAEGHRKKMTWAVANVRKPLISVGKLEEAGHEVIISKQPRLIHLKTGKVTKLRKEGGVYTLDLWIWTGKAGTQGGNHAEPGFTRPK